MNRDLGANAWSSFYSVETSSDSSTIESNLSYDTCLFGVRQTDGYIVLPDIHQLTSVTMQILGFPEISISINARFF